MPQHAIRIVESPVGRLVLAASDAGLGHLALEGSRDLSEHAVRDGRAATAHLDAAATALDEYFAGRRVDFADLELCGEGTEFQQSVWRALREIPFGSTESYGELAERIARPGASRAVGTACNRNPIGIIVPCHRVIGANGRLVGYAGGLPMKEWLLDHEGATEPALFVEAPSRAGAL